MPWPTDDLSTALFDSQSDSPSQALPMLNRLFQRVKSIIAARGQANGICELDATRRVPGVRLGRGLPNGLATLGSNGKVVPGQLDGVLMTQAERNKLGGVEAGARADQTAAEIRALLLIASIPASRLDIDEIRIQWGQVIGTNANRHRVDFPVRFRNPSSPIVFVSNTVGSDPTYRVSPPSIERPVPYYGFWTANPDTSFAWLAIGQRP